MVSQVSTPPQSSLLLSKSTPRPTAPQFGGSKIKGNLDTDAFSPTTGANAKNKPVKFGGVGKALGFGALGLASAAICWPMATGAALLGILIHPLLPVAAVLGVAPFVLAAVGGFMGAKSNNK